MDDKNNNETFNYTYSASLWEEIQDIRKKYLTEEADKMEQLRLLDKSAEKKGRVISLTFGIISLLILGVGMCCTMVWAEHWFIPGIVIGVVGLAGIGAAYPVYRRITKKQREKLAPQILKLTEELMQEGKL